MSYPPPQPQSNLPQMSSESKLSLLSSTTPAAFNPYIPPPQPPGLSNASSMPVYKNYCTSYDTKYGVNSLSQPPLPPGAPPLPTNTSYYPPPPPPPPAQSTTADHYSYAHPPQPPTPVSVGTPYQYGYDYGYGYDYNYTDYSYPRSYSRSSVKTYPSESNRMRYPTRPVQSFRAASTSRASSYNQPVPAGTTGDER